MLQRPEFNTKEHILLWLAGKEGTFFWPSAQNCACAQYMRDNEMYGHGWTQAVHDMNCIAGELHVRKYGHEAVTHSAMLTFRDLESELRLRWGL